MVLFKNTVVTILVIVYNYVCSAYTAFNFAFIFFFMQITDAKTVQSDGIPKGFITITAVASAALILALSIFILIFCWVIKRWRRKSTGVPVYMRAVVSE